MTLSKHWLYVFVKSENLEAFKMYTALTVYHMVHIGNVIYGAPHSDMKPAQTGP